VDVIYSAALPHEEFDVIIVDESQWSIIGQRRHTPTTWAVVTA
jgi:uncharacterized protein YbdZ (MbtH family)